MATDEATCTPEYLQDRMLTLGLAPVEASVIESNPALSNALYAAVEKARMATEELDRLTTTLRISAQDMEHLKAACDALKEKLENMDKAKYKKHMVEHRVELAKLVAENKELSIKFTKVCHKDAMHEAKLAKQEKEYQKLQDRVQKEVRGKEQALKRGMNAVNKLRAVPAKKGPVDDDAPLGPADRLMFQRVIDGYDEKLAHVEAENAANGESVLMLQRQLKTVVNNYERLRRAYLGRGAAMCHAPEDEPLEISEHASPAPATPTSYSTAKAFEWGGAAARDSVVANMEEKMRTLQERMEALEEEGAGAHKAATQEARVKAIGKALSEAKAVMRQQQSLLQQSLLGTPAKSPGLDPEDDWALRSREAELDAREAKLAVERDAVLKERMALDDQRHELNMRWVAAEQARTNFVATPATGGRAATPASGVPTGRSRRQLNMGASTSKARRPLGLRASGNSMTPLAMQASPATRALVGPLLGGGALNWLDNTPTAAPSKPAGPQVVHVMQDAL